MSYSFCWEIVFFLFLFLKMCIKILYTFFILPWLNVCLSYLFKWLLWFLPQETILVKQKSNLKSAVQAISLMDALRIIQDSSINTSSPLFPFGRESLVAGFCDEIIRALQGDLWSWYQQLVFCLSNPSHMLPGTDFNRRRAS